MKANATTPHHNNEIVKSQRIVFLYGAPFDLGWGRSQSLCKGFLEKDHEVFYIEHPVSIRFLFSNKSTVSKKTRGKLHIIKLFGLPVRRFPFLNRLNITLIKYQIKRAIDKDFLTPNILWIYDVADINIVNLFFAEKRVYDCADDRLSRITEQFGEKYARNFQEKENQIMKDVDHIFVVTERLLQNVQLRLGKKENSKFSILNNGMDFDYFYNFRDSQTSIPSALQELNSPIIGYVGTITYWLDLDLIISVAHDNPEYSFVLIGPLRDGMRPISSCKSIFYLEPVPYKEVPKYIKAMDVCMLPFKPIESVLNADSLKILQYFSLGKPVVSTIKPPIREYEGLIWTGADDKGFATAIRAALRESTGLSQQRIKIARDRSWQSICEKALSRIYES